MAKLSEVKNKLTEYEAAAADRETKQSEHIATQATLAEIIDAEEFARDEWLAALKKEHALEDELEALIISHEPPDLPAV